MLKRLSLPLLATLVMTPVMSSPSQAAITLFSRDDLVFTTGGFVETDAIWDSTRSFNEIIGNAPVAVNSANAFSGRNMFSIRNSRLYFQAQYNPAGAMASRGYLEFDLFGYDPSPGSTNTEASFFNNPTFRIRHAYLEVAQDGWFGLAGQYWELFGWQPYYFATTVNVMPLPAMTYARTAQFRVSKKAMLSEATHIETAISASRPPQRDSGLPDFQGGVRVSYDDWQASSGLGSSGKLIPLPLSLGISGLFREIVIPDYSAGLGDVIHYPGAALSINAFVPIVPATTERQANSFSLIGSYTTGRGYGDQFANWTGNTASNLNSAVAGSIANTDNAVRPINLDGGIGDFDSQGAFHLIQLTTFEAGLQYILPCTDPTWIDLGYSRLTSNNMYSLTSGAGGRTSAGLVPYVREDSTYFNFFRDISSHLRVAAEFARIRTSYSDGSIGFNNRYQFSTWFLF